MSDDAERGSTPTCSSSARGSPACRRRSTWRTVGHRVLLVEREASTGGRMIALSKVFPTMDCASCITTPKMSATAHNEGVTSLTYTDVLSIAAAAGGGFEATLVHRPRYVDEDACIGCRLCEYACPVDVPHEFDGGLGARRAVYIPFGTAIPQKAVIDLPNCILCGKCEKACPTDAIDFLQEPETIRVHAGAVVLATGYRPTPTDAKREYSGGTAANVIAGLDMERLLSPNGPYGRVLRPSDGKIPERIAYVQCAGSRDETLGVPYCSRVCCMYAIKQAMLLSGSLPLADITIYYMDIRAFGKGYEQFYQTARAMGIEFVKAKVARITEQPDGDLDLRVELQEEDGRIADRRHDLVVLVRRHPAERRRARLRPRPDRRVRVRAIGGRGARRDEHRRARAVRRRDGARAQGHRGHGRRGERGGDPGLGVPAALVRAGVRDGGGDPCLSAGSASTSATAGATSATSSTSRR